MEFFKEEGQDWYDFDKLVLFCILYCEADLQIKANCLFYLLSEPETDTIHPKGPRVKRILAYLTIITCVITAEILRSVSGKLACF